MSIDLDEKFLSKFLMFSGEILLFETANQDEQATIEYIQAKIMPQLYEFLKTAPVHYKSIVLNLIGETTKQIHRLKEDKKRSAKIESHITYLKVELDQCNKKIDECGSNASLEAYRTQLLSSINQFFLD